MRNGNGYCAKVVAAFIVLWLMNGFGVVGICVVEGAVAVDAAIHAGNIVTIERLGRKVRVIDMEKALTRKQFEPKEEEWVQERERNARENHEFIAVVVQLKQGRSIGLFDYHIGYGEGQKAECIGIALSGSVFDPRRWEVISVLGGEQVRMLYEVPINQDVLEITFALPVSVGLKTVEVALDSGDMAGNPGNGESRGRPERRPELQGDRGEIGTREVESAPFGVPVGEE